jgi:hypothetical protein
MDKRAATDVAALALPGLHQKCPSLQVAKGHPRLAAATSSRARTPTTARFPAATQTSFRRGNMILFFKCVYCDARERIYQRDLTIIDKGSDRDDLSAAVVLSLAKRSSESLGRCPARCQQAQIAGW